MERRNLLTVAILVLTMMSTSFGASLVLGDFEDETLDGWGPGGDSTIAQSTTGATLGSHALQVDAPSGWGTRASLGSFTAEILGEPDSKVCLDVTGFAEDAPADPCNFRQLAVVMQGPVIGWWVQFPNQDYVADGNSYTLTWEVSDDLRAKAASAPSSANFQIISNTDGSGHKFYVDNVRIEYAGPEDEEEAPKSTDTVIGNWEEDTDGWNIAEDYDPLYSDVNGVTLDNFSLDLYRENGGGWNNIMTLNVFDDPNLLAALKANTKLTLDVTTLVENYPDPFSSHNEIAVVINAGGAGWDIWQILTKAANWTPSRGDVTDNVVADYSPYLPQMNYLEDVTRFEFILINNSGNDGIPFWRYFDNCKLIGANRALNPVPADGAKDVHVDTELSWIPGAAWSSQHIYLGTDAQAVIDANQDSDPNVLFVDLTDSSFQPDEKLVFNTEYFWRIDGVNELNVDSTWDGSLLSFTTAAFHSIDDFEDYNDANEDTAIYSVWTDGWLPDDQVNPENGAVIFTKVSVDEGQSMGLEYDNTVAPVSTTFREWAEPQDWTLDGLNAYKLELSTFGQQLNVAGELFVIIEDANGESKKIVNEDASIFTNTEGWATWKIPVGDAQNAGVNLTKVTKLTIGIDSVTGQDAAEGILFVDDILGELPVSIVLDENHLTVPIGDTAPTIDGEWDAAWDDVNETEMLIWEVGDGAIEPDDANDLSAIFKAFFGEDNVYLFIEVTDDIINEGDSNWKGDGIEFYFDGDYSHGDSYDGVDDEHIRITIDDVDLSGVQSEHDLEGTEFKVKLTDKGYNIEVAFPLDKLQIYPSADPDPIYGPDGEMIPGSDIARNNVVGFELQINDNDEEIGATPNRTHQLRWYSDDNDSWQNPSLFGQARMVGATD